MDHPSSIFRSRSVCKSSRQPRGRTTIKLPCTPSTILRRNSPAINTEQLQQQQQQEQEQYNDDAAPAAEGLDEDDMDVAYDDGAQQPSAAAFSAAAVRFRYTAARQRQPRSAAANRAASERNWAVLQQPDAWIASLHNRAALSAGLNSALKLHIEERCMAAECPNCGSGPKEMESLAEVVLVSLTALVKAGVPRFRCCRCSGMFSQHPYAAGCYPGTPVAAVRLNSTSSAAPALWFTADLMQYMFVQRQHVRTFSTTSAAAALHQCISSQGFWVREVRFERLKRSLRDALNSYAALQVNCDDPQHLGLPAEGIVDCCDVCSQSHMGFLQQQGAAHLRDGVPVLGPHPNTTEQQQEHQSSAAAAAAVAEDLHVRQQQQQQERAQQQPPEHTQQEQPQQQSTQQQQQQQPQQQQQQPQQQSTQQQQQQPQQQQPQQQQQQPAQQSTQQQQQQQPQQQPWQSQQHAGGQEDGQAPPPHVQLMSNPLPSFQPRTQPCVIQCAVVDGLMRLPHLAKAGSASTAESLAVKRMVPDGRMREYAAFDPLPPQSRARRQADNQSQCHSFTADAVLGRTSEVYDINGILSLLCRHGFALLVVNMPTGERFVYAQALLHILMGVHLVWPYMCLYDINCKFGPHTRRVAIECGRTGLWPDAAAAWGSGLAIPLPPFHRHMHSISCANRHALELILAAGTGSGEPTEVMNRFLGVAGSVLQYATKAVRAVWVEALLQAWRRKKEHDLPLLLGRMWGKAYAQLLAYSLENGELFNKALDAGVDAGLLEEYWQPPDTLEEPAVSMDLPWQATMAELVLLVEALSAESVGAAAIDEVLPADLLTGGSSASSLVKRQQQLDALMRAHDVPDAWALQSSELLDGVAQLCLHKVRSLQAVLANGSARFVHIRWLQQHLGPARTLHRSLDRQLSSERTKMTSSVKELLRWAGQLRQSVQHLLPHDGEDCTEAVLQSVGLSAGATWASVADDEAGGTAGSGHELNSLLVQQLCAGQLPWEPDIAAMNAAELPLPCIKKRMQLNALKIRAAAEELELVQFEFGSLHRSYASRIDTLTQAISRNLEQQDECTAVQQQLREAAGNGVAAATANLSGVSQQLNLLVGRQVLLQRRLEHFQGLQALALQVDSECQASADGSLPPSAAAAAAADMLVADAEAEAISSEDDLDYAVESEDDADDMQPASRQAAATATATAATEAAAAAETAHTSGAAAAAAAASVDAAAAGRAPAAAPSAAAAAGQSTASPAAAAADSTSGEAGASRLHAGDSHQAFAANSVVWCGGLPWRAGASALALLAGIKSRAASFPDTLFHATPYPLELGLIGSLADGQRVDGEVITAFMHALNARTSKLIRRADAVPAVYFMNTYFMTRLLDGEGYNFTDATTSGGASRRTMEVCGAPFTSILDYSMVVAPCHIKHPISSHLDHWVLTVADLEQRTIQTIDPLMAPHEDFADAMEAFLTYTARTTASSSHSSAKLAAMLDGSWVHSTVCDLPPQQDGVNCGVFAMVFADCLSAGFPLRECPLWGGALCACRAHIAESLLQGADAAKAFLLGGAT